MGHAACIFTLFMNSFTKLTGNEALSMQTLYNLGLVCFPALVSVFMNIFCVLFELLGITRRKLYKYAF